MHWLWQMLKKAPRTSPHRKKRLLAVASGGGHWIELLRLRPAFEEFQVSYVSMFDNYAASIPGSKYYTVPDGSRFNKGAALTILLRSIYIMLRERPHAIITTGSAPMLSFVLLGRLTRARVLWIDSLANSEHISTSGRVAKKLAHRTICQWENVAEDEGLECWGRVV